MVGQTDLYASPENLSFETDKCYLNRVMYIKQGARQYTSTKMHPNLFVFFILRNELRVINERFKTLDCKEACSGKNPPVEASPSLDWCYYSPLNLVLGEHKEKRRGYLVLSTW